jgi:putative transposase
MLMVIGMSEPREIVRGTTYLLTRRCFQRQFLLKPSALVCQIVLYCLAVAAKSTGMLVHAVCVMANHYHMVVTDVNGLLPDFMHWLNKHVARCLNEHYGRRDALWSTEPYSAVRVLEDTDIIAKVVYTLQNPVAAGLVSESAAWPGLCTTPEDMLGRVLEVERPPVYFSKKSHLAKITTLTLTTPPGVDRERFVADTRGLLTFTEQQHRAKRAAAGKRFLGRKRVLAQRHTDMPKTDEPKRKEGDIRPTIACGDKWRRIEALQRHKAFLRAYREAWLEHQETGQEVVFPHGTYWWVRFGQMPCAPPG